MSSEITVLPFSLYLLGLSLGPIIAGPASERFGRKAVYLSSLPLFAIFTLGAGFSNNAASLTVLRFFAGLFSSPGLSIGTGTLADVWPRACFPLDVFSSSSPSFKPLTHAWQPRPGPSP